MFTKRKKQIKSQTCISAKHKITVGEKEIKQTQYFTEHYVYTESGDKKILYLPEKDKQYMVDTENKQLKELDLSAQMAQINQLKAMIGEIAAEERTEGKIRSITMQNKPGSPAALKADLQITRYEGLEKTVFQKSNEFQQSMQLFRMDLKKNEIVKRSESVFSVNGQEQKSILELSEIKNETGATETIDEYFNYKIIK